MAAVPRIVAAKLERPTAPVADVRPDLVARAASAARHVAIVGPPGYGKSFLAGEIHAARPPGTAAWLSVDLLDRQPYTFWSHLIAALRGTSAQIDDEPGDLLAERPTSDPTFLAALAQQLRTSPQPIVLVLDDVDQIHDPEVLAGLERLAEWADGQLRYVLTGRLDPSLPLAEWRARGLLAELRQADLRFDRPAAERFLAEVGPDALEPADVDALLDRTEGWPMALQIAAVVTRGAADPHRAVREMTSTGRVLSDYVTREVLESLTEPQRDIALGLSVLDWFDQDLCAEVLGLGAVPVVRELQHRGLPLTDLADRDGFRWHSLVRELLESELGWRDPARRRELHRRAGEALLRRGDRVAAVRHLVSCDEHERASEVMAGPALALVDGGRIAELRLALAQLPSDAEIGGAERVIDVALAQVLVGRRREFEWWTGRARSMAHGDELSRDRWRLLELLDAMLFGRTADVRHLVDDGLVTAPSPGDWYWDARRAAILVRTHALELPDAEWWLEQLRRSPAPSIVRRILVPSIESSLAFGRGQLEEARRGARTALEHLDLSDDHPTAYDALLAAGWCAWAVADFDRSRELADRVRTHPSVAFPLQDMRVTVLVVDQLVRLGRSVEAIQLLDQIDPSDLDGDAVRTMHALALARALHGAGRPAEVERTLTSLDASPARDVLLAWSAVRQGRPDDAGARIAAAADWPAQIRLEAALVTAMSAAGEARDRLVAQTVADAAVDGWVAPLLGHGADVDASLRRSASAHPGLAAALTPVPGRPAARPPVTLTERESTLLHLLPTHLSYSQMGERLYVSVNTIKSNLKSIYRKLDAGSRDEAIRAARVAGLLPDDGVGQAGASSTSSTRAT